MIVALQMIYDHRLVCYQEEHKRWPGISCERVFSSHRQSVQLDEGFLYGILSLISIDMGQICSP